MASALRASRPLTSLPTELCLQIWEETFYPRVVELHTRRCKSSDGEEIAAWVSNCANPVALSVCSQSRAIALKHYIVLLPVSKSEPARPNPRYLYFAPRSDLLVVLGDADYMRVEDLFRTIQLRDPIGRGLRRFGLSMGCWAHNFKFATFKTWDKALFDGLDEFVLLMYDEQRPPSSFRGGECVLEPVVGMDSLSRILSSNLQRLFRPGHFRLRNLGFVTRA